MGISNNLDHRLISHRTKKNVGTKEFSDLQLVYKECGLSKQIAARREKQLKGWSRAKKKALIDGDIELLKKLSK